MKTEMNLLLQALFLSLSLCLLPFVASEIQLGSKLVVGEENASWVSKNGDFALGFFTPPGLPNRFSIGIRFNSQSIPSDQRKVVWVAGAGVSVSDNASYFEFTSDGDLVLFDSSLGVPVWTSKTNRFSVHSVFSSVSSALLGDDGNLVLLDDKEEIVWESFDTPADTLLPNQKLKAFEMLRAASESSRSSYYSLHMVGSGRLELRWESNITFWSSTNQEAVKKRENLSAVLTPEGALLVSHQDITKPVWSVFGEDHNDTVKFRFLRLDRDGNLRMYSFQESSRTWRTVWQAVENQCRVFATCGSQVCSFNGSGDSQCTCPYNAFASKCLTPYQKLSCKSGFSMVTFENMELYGIYPANDTVVSPVSSLRCKKMCLEDDACTAVTYKNDVEKTQCVMKLTRYVSGYYDASLSSVSYVKTCLDPRAVDPSKGEVVGSVTKKSHSVCLSCLLGVTSTTFVLFLAFQVCVVVYVYKRKKKEAVKRAERVRNPNPKGVVVFSVEEIKEMTNDFEDNIGPKMFKGVMSENELVLVKEIEGALTEERKFRSSAAKIGTMHHKNLAKLEGYCCERGKRFLVYEYAKNGSLLDHHAKNLTWRRRNDVCLSVAKALFYLHSECREFVSHGSLSLGNILIGEEFEAKLTEYGFGSCAADKDVEDFGKMVLALVTGGCEEEWVYREWIEGRGETVVDRSLEGGFDVEELERVLRISFWCVQVDERLRPSMGEVVKVLEGTLSVDPPPPPFVCARSSATNSSESGMMNWKEHGRKIPKENLDRFIPNRSAMDFDFAHHALTEALIEARDGKKEEPLELSPSKEAYRKRLAETLGLNRTRILAFRNKPQPPPHSHYYSHHQQQQPLKPRRRRIPQSCSKVLDAPNMLDDFYLNLLDWGSRNVLAIALGHTLYLWDASTGSVSEFVTIEEDQGPITSISWAPDGSHVALGLDNSQVQLWDSSSNRKIRTLNGVHHSRVGSLAWNNHILTTGGMDGMIVNNDVRIRSHVVDTYRGHTGEICGLKWSGSGMQLASGGNDNVVHVWDRSSASPTHRLEEHTSAVKALAWCPFQSNLLATGGGGIDGAIKFWNTHTGACLNSLDTGSQVCALLWSKNDRELLSSHGFSHNHLALWKYPSLVKMAELTGHTSRVLYMTQSPDGCTVASAAGDESLRFWDVFGMPETAKKPDQKAAAHEPFSRVPRIR